MTPPLPPMAKAFFTSAMKADRTRFGATTLRQRQPRKRAISRPMSAGSKSPLMGRNLLSGAISPAIAWNLAVKKTATHQSPAPAPVANMTSLWCAIGTNGKRREITAACSLSYWVQMASLAHRALQWTAPLSVMPRPSPLAAATRSAGTQTAAALPSHCG